MQLEDQTVLTGAMQTNMLTKRNPLHPLWLCSMAMIIRTCDLFDAPSASLAGGGCLFTMVTGPPPMSPV